MQDLYESTRDYMVRHQIESRGITNATVLAAMRKVPRNRFVNPGQEHVAYSDGPLPIGNGQTISQPYIVAYMTELLQLSGTERVLELGTGCGYQTAVLAEIVQHVYTIEVVEALATAAKDRLTRELHYKNISFKTGNGREGWEKHAPFDRIIITAAPHQFPHQLFAQLTEGGIAVAPVGAMIQQMMRYTKSHNKIMEEALIGVAFVPFV